MKQCAYIGPAPVPIEDYIEQTYRQAVTGISCSPEPLRATFSHLVIKEDLFSALGPAIVSGRSVFIYGPPGNGETAMTQAIQRAPNLPERDDASTATTRALRLRSGSEARS